MQLHKRTFLNKLAKQAAQPLSYIVCSKFFSKPVRAFDAYLNFLLGKGSGTGWDMKHEIQGAVSRIYCEAPVVFDVGANIGEWSARLLRALPTARVFLFEPSPACQREIQARTLNYTALIPSAVSDRIGRATLHFSSALDGSASLHPRGESYFREREYTAIEVPVVTIDSVIQEQKLEFVDFLKMDIEGHELIALRGAQESLKAHRIGALSFEFGSSNINSHTFFRDFWTLLNTHEFRLWRITPGGRLLSVEDYYEDSEYFRGATNYIAELKDHPRRQSPTKSQG